MHFTTELIYQNEFHIQHGKTCDVFACFSFRMWTKYWRTVPRYAMVKEAMQIRFKIVRHPCWSPRKNDKNYIEDTVTTPKSCLDVVFELLATIAGTSSSNSLLESVRLLESQLQVERHRSDVMPQEAEGPRKSLQNPDAYFLVQQQVLEDLSAKQEKVNKLSKHLASIMGTPDIVS